jgi:hypothetical protein
MAPIKKSVKKKVVTKKRTVKKRATKKPLKKNAGGRPLELTKELALELCDRLIAIGSLRTVCEADDMPSKTTVFRWILKAEEEDANEIYSQFSDQYARARKLSKDFRFDELDHALDDAAKSPVLDDNGEPIVIDGKVLTTVTSQSVQYARLKLDSFKWQSSKEDPKKYGDKVTAEHTGKDGGPISLNIADDELDRRIQQLESQCDQDSQEQTQLAFQAVR